MNNIDELTAKLKAAAKLRIEADSWPGSDGRIARMGVYIETGDDISPANILTLIEALEAAEKRIADQRGIILSSRKFISEYAGLGDVGAAEFLQIIDRAGGGITKVGD